MGSVKYVLALIKYHGTNADGTVIHIHVDGQPHALNVSEACSLITCNLQFLCYQYP
jgi:hypothetical protein